MGMSVTNLVKTVWACGQEQNTMSSLCLRSETKDKFFVSANYELVKTALGGTKDNVFAMSSVQNKRQFLRLHQLGSVRAGTVGFSPSGFKGFLLKTPMSLAPGLNFLTIVLCRYSLTYGCTVQSAGGVVHFVFFLVWVGIMFAYQRQAILNEVQYIKRGCTRGQEAPTAQRHDMQMEIYMSRRLKDMTSCIS